MSEIFGVDQGDQPEDDPLNDLLDDFEVSEPERSMLLTFGIANGSEELLEVLQLGDMHGISFTEALRSYIASQNPPATVKRHRR
jgi:hypothetical protein